MQKSGNKSPRTHFLEIFAERTSKIIFSYDVEENCFIYLNPEFQHFWNKPKEEVSANPNLLLESIHPDDREFLTRTFQQLIEGEEKKEVDFRVQFSEEGERWLSVSPHLIEEEPNQRVIVGIAEDISKQRDKQANMQKFVARKDSIMEILSHDLAGPLINIKGIASMLADELKGQEHPKLNKLVDMIHNTSERSIRLIREFVKSEFLQSEQSELVKRRVDVVSVLREVLEQYEGSEADISKKFHFNISEEPIFAKIDAYKFTQVINNLVSNAIKFTEDEGEITITLEDRQENIFISVADNGIGIPAKYHENLFEKFTKARRKGLKGEPSVGLGMSIIQTIVEWHDGRIWFESEENKGTTFCIELPRE